MRRALLLWLLRMACADAALWGVYAALAAQQPASRRACNAAYMAWLLALNLLLLLALACVDALSRALGAHGAQACAPARATCTPAPGCALARLLPAGECLYPPPCSARRIKQRDSKDCKLLARAAPHSLRPPRNGM